MVASVSCRTSQGRRGEVYRCLGGGGGGGGGGDSSGGGGSGGCDCGCGCGCGGSGGGGGGTVFFKEHRQICMNGSDVVCDHSVV